MANSRVAGADTTAISMTFALYYALATPRVWKRLCKEVREKSKSEDEISGQTTQAIPYLTAIINEGTPTPLIYLTISSSISSSSSSRSPSCDSTRRLCNCRKIHRRKCTPLLKLSNYKDISLSPNMGTSPRSPLLFKS